jgi:hypothetical protein
LQYSTLRPVIGLFSEVARVDRRLVVRIGRARQHDVIRFHAGSSLQAIRWYTEAAALPRAGCSRRCGGSSAVLRLPAKRIIREKGRAAGPRWPSDAIRRRRPESSRGMHFGAAIDKERCAMLGKSRLSLRELPPGVTVTVNRDGRQGKTSMLRNRLEGRMLLATPRLLAGWVKMPGERDCFARFEREWICN